MDSFPHTAISLCTGGGGLDLGVKLAMPNCRVVVYVGREAFWVEHLVRQMVMDLILELCEMGREDPRDTERKRKLYECLERKSPVNA